MANPDLLPSGRGLPRHPIIHSEILAVGRLVLAVPTLSVAALGLFKEDSLIPMGIDHKSFPAVLQIPQKGPILAVGSIRRHPGKAHSVAPRPLYDLQSQCRLRLESSAFQRNAGSFASCGVFYPFARQIQFCIDQAYRLAAS